MKKQAVLSLSGGMDSSSLLLYLLSNEYEVTSLGFNYGQKHRIELDRALSLTSMLAREGFSVTYKEIDITGITELLHSSLVTGGDDVPEGHYEHENMKATVVPNRNKIFASIIQAVALSISMKKKTIVDIAMGIHAGDHAIYPDCRQEFRDADFEAFKLGNWGSENVSIITPYLHLNKFDILKDAQISCKMLGINFNEVFKRTNTSYKPVRFNNRWYSDYKSASSVERIEAFIKLGIPDPVEYADETGPVSWETAKSHVETVLTTH